MRVRVCLIEIVLVIAASSTTALAMQHEMRIDEVMVSHGGSTASQFVELQDPGEPFPNPPYSIELFDAAGGSLGSQTLTVPSGTTRLLIATAAAASDFGVTADATLTLSLPTSGQLCFKQSTARIHCLGWGTITSAVIGTVTDSGPSPPDGQSLQREGTSYVLDTPTPGQANPTPPVVDGHPDAGVAATDAPIDLIDGGGGIDSGGGGGGGGKGGGCGVGPGSGAFWFGGLAVLALVGFARARRR